MGDFFMNLEQNNNQIETEEEEEDLNLELIDKKSLRAN